MYRKTLATGAIVQIQLMRKNIGGVPSLERFKIL